MVKKNCKIVGIEVRSTTDPKTHISSERYYLHAISSDGNLISGNSSVFSAKLPDDIVSHAEVGSTYDVAYRMYNGWCTVEGLYRV